MNLVVTPGNPLLGTVTLPGDKSISHRAALLAALANGRSEITNFLNAGVTEVLLKALSTLGVQFSIQGSDLTIQGKGLDNLKIPKEILDCGNSATVLRLLSGVIAAAGIPAVLDGSHGLRRRPMMRIVEPLQKMGVPIHASADGTPPIILERRSPGRRLKGIEYTMDVASAQVKSCILLASLAADDTSTIREIGYTRDHTERLLAHMGVNIATDYSNGYPTVQIHAPQPLSLKPLDIAIPGDFSSASFVIVAALVTPGSEITLQSIGLNSTRTGLLDVLREMGAEIRIEHKENQFGEECGDLTVRYSPLQAVNIDGDIIVRMIDELPVLGIAAAFANGQTSVSQAEELRNKESDRIAVLCSQLLELNIDVTEMSDGFRINGGRLPAGGKVHAEGDHRIAMAMAILGLAAQNKTIIEGAEIISESFPNFIDTLGLLGANLEYA